MSVCDDWLNFQNFALWFYDNNIDGFVIDKDLFSTEIKMYSPDTCVFIPPELNTVISKLKESKGYKKLPSGNYCTNISLNNKKKYLGTYCSKEDAKNAFKLAKSNYILSKAFDVRLPMKVKIKLIELATELITDNKESISGAIRRFKLSQWAAKHGGEQEFIENGANWYVYFDKSMNECRIVDSYTAYLFEVVYMTKEAAEKFCEYYNEGRIKL